MVFSEAVEEGIEKIVQVLKSHNFKSDIDYRFLAINLLKEDKYTYKLMHDEPIWIELQPVLKEVIEHIKLHHNEENIIDAMAEEFMAFNQGVILKL